jgi:PII-like signaling protein
MDLPADSCLLRVFVGEAARHAGRPLHEAIVLRAREARLAGATVIRCVEGYGKSSRLHKSKVLRLSDDLPLVVEIVDSEERINAFLPELERMMPSGLVTLEKVRAHFCGGAKAPASPG